MLWIFKQLPFFSDFHNIPQIHHRNAVAQVMDNTQVVGNKDVGQAMLLLQLLHQIQDLRLD